ncbi:MAG TPA: nuclear transport factor 2 family protein [Acidimicrobiia bacterium]|nr:nuclear transport factor 2 family protein [Acidimicrobiia bacterium]
MSNTNTVSAYFAAMRSKDVEAHRVLFANDAELVTSQGTFVGTDAISSFYRDFAFSVEDLWPEPGPFIVAGNRIAVELEARASGAVSMMADFFTVRNGKISRLAIYTGPRI